MIKTSKFPRELKKKEQIQENIFEKMNKGVFEFFKFDEKTFLIPAADI